MSPGLISRPGYAAIEFPWLKEQVISGCRAPLPETTNFAAWAVLGW